MQISLSFGESQKFELQLKDEKIVAICDGAGPTLSSVRSEVETALTNPPQFPGLAEATVPGDLIAFAIGRHIPNVADIIAAILDVTARAEMADRRTAIVLPHDAADHLQAAVTAMIGERTDVTLERHDPDDRNKLAFIGASKENRPIMVNRILSDADMVIPVGLARLDSSLDYFGPYEAVFPTFTDRETMQRLSAPTFVEQPVLRKRRAGEATEAGHLLGVLFGIVVEANGPESISAIRAGAIDLISAQIQDELAKTWRYQPAKRAALTIVAISGGQEQQTWANFARSLAVASNAADDNGAILVCSELTTFPSPTMMQLAEHDDLDEQRRRIRRERTADAAAALQLATTLDRNKVYLISNLPEGIVDELNMSPVANLEEARKVCEYYESCTFIAHGQLAEVAVEGEEISSDIDWDQYAL
ncbi:lactate racemase domain-containing protein [Blastopirellula sp. JC732]|uniref:Lactate racemase domain-containing protein n=1 Tax=Blastopirellula sediminis TaxID=2894196 RepID=A0A9X1SED8_9BACT|nr:lactate racemase domain-containing protein [Blastopirellula sediminis]MCC9609478.1 lactate racemase domain-containing protein [Blastopirellula sediminis]MCC9627745.1 lactate racemase domain-containing protein [Blastopirellula sediminis]